MNTTFKTILKTTTAALLLSAALPSVAGNQRIIAKLEHGRFALLNCSGDISRSKSEVTQQVMSCLALISDLKQIWVNDTADIDNWTFTGVYNGKDIRGVVVITSHH